MDQHLAISLAVCKPDDKELVNLQKYTQRKRRDLAAEQAAACGPPNKASHQLALTWGLSKPPVPTFQSPSL